MPLLIHRPIGEDPVAGVAGLVAAASLVAVFFARLHIQRFS